MAFKVLVSTIILILLDIVNYGLHAIIHDVNKSSGKATYNNFKQT